MSSNATMTVDLEDMDALVDLGRSTSRWVTELDEIMFTIVEGYSDTNAARDAFQRVKRLREEVNAVLHLPGANEFNKKESING